MVNPVYTGAIASQKTEDRFKIGMIRDKKPEDWIVVEGVEMGDGGWNGTKNSSNWSSKL